MGKIYQKHITITNQIKEEIKELKVVFPAYYGKLYAELASAHDVALEPHELLGHEMLDEKMVRHILSLSMFAEEAIDAMKTQNALKLEKILIETQKLREEIKELQAIVYQDTLTQAFNRKWFEDSFLDATKKVLSKSGILVIIDINRFKRINDEFGHVIGDKVLVHMSSKLKESGAEVVRYGGDEFLILFGESVSLLEVQNKMQTILNYVEKVAFKVDQTEFKITFAYGITPFLKDEMLSKALDIADKEMYHLKKGRREGNVV